MPDSRDRLASVLLYGRRLGTLRSRGLTSDFRFSRDYLEGDSRPVLGLRFEERLEAVYTGQSRLPAWFENLLPEGRLREMLLGQVDDDDGRPKLETDFDLLLRLGSDLPGAVQVLEGGTDDFVGSEQSAERANIGVSAEPATDDGLRFSVAGVGLKFSMAVRERQFVLPSRGQDGEWLVKMPDPQFRHLPVNEHAMMSLAREIGIDVPEIRLLHRDELQRLPESAWAGEEYAYAIRRFDRDRGDRVHIEDLAQVRGYNPDERYKGNYETVASLVYRGEREGDLIELTRRLTLNLLIANWDAHLKNFSLRYEDRMRPALSPAYDVVSVAPYREQNLSQQVALRMANTRRPEDHDAGSFARLARKIGSSADLDQVALDATSSAVESWPAISDMLDQHAPIRERVGEHLHRAAARMERRAG